jgi:hypothetical protein
MLWYPRCPNKPVVIVFFEGYVLLRAHALKSVCFKDFYNLML